jgi:hypothetical protein
MASDERRDDGEPVSRLELPSLKTVLRRRMRTHEAALQPEPEEPDETADPEGSDASVERPQPAPKRRRERRPSRFHLPGPLVALVTGAVVGLALVGLTSASLQLCSSLRGTSSCRKPGILLLLAIIVVAILLGSLLLRLAGVDAHGSTSFLGVGLLVVLILLALLPVLDEWWMVIVVPVLAMLTYVASWWLTTAYADPAQRPR